MPLKISKTGFKLVKKLVTDRPEFAKYETMLMEAVAVRFLQKMRCFYVSVKLENVYKYLVDFGNESEVEQFLYHCNKTGLFHTVLDYTTNSLSFDSKTEVLASLEQFGLTIN